MTKKTWIVFSLIVVGIFATIIYLSRSNSIDVSNVDENKVLLEKKDDSGNIVVPGDHVYGKKDSQIVLIEYGDYQCPACEGAFPKVKQITERYKDQVAFVWRSLPLTSIHPNALAASNAVEAAALQGKFWEMHDQLFTNQASWKDASASERGSVFEGFAQTIGLDLDKYRTDTASAAVSYKIDYDRALARKAGATSTPTFVLNGQKLSEDEVSDIVQNKGEKLMKKLDDEIKKRGGTPPAETTQPAGGNM